MFCVRIIFRIAAARSSCCPIIFGYNFVFVLIGKGIYNTFFQYSQKVFVDVVGGNIMQPFDSKLDADGNPGTWNGTQLWIKPTALSFYWLADYKPREEELAKFTVIAMG